MSTTTETPTVTIHIPTPLRSAVDDQAKATATGATAGEALRHLAEQHPDLQSNLYTEDGALRQFVNIYLNDEDIRYLDGEDTELSAGDELSIVPSIAGGIG
jgi:molybdopterin converting factor small subunit